MKTACGAVLIATQLTAVVQVGGGHERGGRSVGSGSQSKASEARREPPQSATSGTAPAENSELEQYFEAIDGTGAPVDIVYRINAGKKKLVESTLPHSGATQAFPLDQETELVFWKAPR